MKTYKIHLIRHGLTEGNITGKYIGREDIPLSKAGISDLEGLKKNCYYPEADAVFSSPLKRALETANILYPDSNPIPIEGLTEYNFGEFEGKTAENLKNNEDFLNWICGSMDAAPPFGESNAEFGKRISSTFEKIINGILKTETENSVIITHGGVINCLMAMYALPEAKMTDWMTNGGCGYTLRLTPYLWSMGKKLEAINTLPLTEEPIDSRDPDYSYMISDIEENEEKGD